MTYRLILSELAKQHISEWKHSGKLSVLKKWHKYSSHARTRGKNDNNINNTINISDFQQYFMLLLLLYIDT